MTDAASDSRDGYIAFTRVGLQLYDALVLGAVCHLAWRCPTNEILGQYRQYMSTNHLEVGVGTGYFLANSQPPTEPSRLVLMDMNTNCLDHTAQRLAARQPEVVQADILQVIPWSAPKFDSIALNYVLHCLPGSMQRKSVALTHLGQLLNPGGVLFGATVLHEGVPRNLAARGLAAYLNARRLFSNREDSLAALEQALRAHFGMVEIRTVGSVALFVARE